MSQVLAPTGPKPTVAQRVLGFAAVTVARGLAALPPKRIRQVLGVVRRGARPATYDEALRARTIVTTVSVRCAGRYCLDRSLATALLCRVTGTWPRWCAGVRTIPPFASHAWVEVDGRPVGEPEIVAGYRAMVSA
jgi:transglutaminase superfamily protein